MGLSYDDFYTSALRYTYNFLEYLRLIAEKCENKFIPPLYKTQQTEGLVNYYLYGFPNRCGKKMYASASTIDPSLQSKKSLEQFTKAFLRHLKDNKNVVQAYTDFKSSMGVFNDKSRTDRDSEDSRQARKEPGSDGERTRRGDDVEGDLRILKSHTPFKRPQVSDRR